MRIIKRIKRLIAVTGLISILVPHVIFATPTGDKAERIIKETAAVQTEFDFEEKNPTGIERSINGNTTLKQDVKSLVPYLEKLLNKAYENAKRDVQRKISENGWDETNTLLSFTDKGNPYKDLDYNALIAAYATISAHGLKNGKVLSVVPMVIPVYEEATLEDGTRYAEVTMKVLSMKGLFKYYGYDPDDPEIKKEYEFRKKKIEDTFKKAKIAESMFIETRESVSRYLEEWKEPEYMGDYVIPADASPKAKLVIKAALSLLGGVPYDWGGKPSKPGYDTSWWTGKSGGGQKGLDCSGFVQWAFMTAGYGKEITDGLLSTYSIRESCQYISRDELKPGDLGLMKNNSEGTNHVGIYIGNNMFIHCSSGAHTVTAGEYGFRYFMKVPDGEIDDSIPKYYIGTGLDDVFDTSYDTGSKNGTYTFPTGKGGIPYTDEEAYTFAQLLEHEVGGESVNSWIACGEVVLNRVNYEGSFENTLLGVIYEPHQFSYVEEIKDIKPRVEMIAVAMQILDGTLKYFDNDRVVFFKNPMITNGIPSTMPIDWGSHPWYAAVDSTAFYLDHK